MKEILHYELFKFLQTVFVYELRCLNASIKNNQKQKAILCCNFTSHCHHFVSKQY